MKLASWETLYQYFIPLLTQNASIIIPLFNASRNALHETNLYNSWIQFQHMSY